MFGWRKRRDGFEWRQYVRTTILVRRERRRQRIDDLRDAAIDGLKEAGRKGADGAAVGLGAAGREARKGFGAFAATSREALRGLASRIGPTAGRVRRRFGRGLAPLVSVPRRVADRLHVTAGSWHLDSSLAQVALLLGAVAAGTGLYAWWGHRGAGEAHTAGLVASGGGAPATGVPARIEGRATATAGDTLRIGAHVVRLGGIEAPDRGQSCVRSTGKRWDCGEAATKALARQVRGKTVVCDVSGRGAAGVASAACKAGDEDIAAALVSNGHVFAETGLFAAYSGLEAKAREARAGLWGGDSERPAAWRARRWEDARKTAPDGCPIKGQVSSGARVYVLPWAPGYDRVKVRAARGERWFCSEKDAISAGWKAESAPVRRNS